MPKNLLELVSEARRKGLDGICITDHDQMGLTQYAAKIAEQENYPIFVGVEYLACEGDIVAFGIDRLPEPHLMAQEFIDYVTARGGHMHIRPPLPGQQPRPWGYAVHAKRHDRRRSAQRQHHAP